MSLDATVDAMIAVGCSKEQIAAVVRAHCAAEKSAAEIERAWLSTRDFVLKRDGYVCKYCGQENSFHCDHVVPRSRGGTSIPENLVASCKSCNSSKKDRPLSEWKGRR